MITGSCSLTHAACGGLLISSCSVELAQQLFQTLPQRERYTEEVTLFWSAQHCSQFQITWFCEGIRLIESKKNIIYIYIEWHLHVYAHIYANQYGSNLYDTHYLGYLPFCCIVTYLEYNKKSKQCKNIDKKNIYIAHKTEQYKWSINKGNK